jgi:hypothetical protein
MIRRDFRAKIAGEARAKAASACATIDALVLGAVTAIVRGEMEHQPAWVGALAGNLDADVQAHPVPEERKHPRVLNRYLPLRSARI